MPVLLFALADVAAVMLTAVPWLWPFTWGPQAATEPYLAAAVTAAILLAYLPWRGARRAFTLAVIGWMLAATLNGGIALLQYFHLESWGWPWINQSQTGMAFGNLRQPNLLATHLVIGLLAAWWMTRTRKLPGPVAGVVVLVMLAGLAASASRVGMVEIITVALLGVYWAWRSGQATFAAAATDRLSWQRAGMRGLLVVALYLLAVWLLPVLLNGAEGQSGRNLVERWEHAEDTCGSRLILWRDVLRLIAQKPWGGWGWGDLAWAHYITPYEASGLPRFCHILDNAHNLPLHLAVTLGLPATIVICALALLLIGRARPWRETDTARQLAWGVLLAMGIHSLVEYPLWYGPFQIAALLCLWLLWSTRRGAWDDRGQVEASVTLPWCVTSGVLAVALLGFVGYASWDYWRIGQLFLAADERARPFRANALEQAQRSWLFNGVVQFADVTTLTATRENAATLLPEALAALHFSPEPRVIKQVIASASLLGKDAVVMEHMARMKAAFPDDYQAWSEANRRALETSLQEQASEPGGMASEPEERASQSPDASSTSDEDDMAADN